MQVKKLGFLFALIAVLFISVGAFAATGDVAAWSEFQTKINAAAAGDTINITADLTVTSKDTSANTASIYVTKDLTINGNNHVIDGRLISVDATNTVSSSDSLIYVTGTPKVVIKNLTIKNVGSKLTGSGNPGGGESIAIYANTTFTGVLSVDNCVFEGTNNPSAKNAAANFLTGVLLGNSATDVFTASVTNSTFKAGSGAIYGVVCVPGPTSSITISNNKFEGSSASSAIAPNRSSAISLSAPANYKVEKNVITGSFYSGVRIGGEAAVSFKENTFQVAEMRNVHITEGNGVAVYVQATTGSADIAVYNNVFAGMADTKVFFVSGDGKAIVASMDVTGNKSASLAYVPSNIAAIINIMKYYYVAPDPTKPVVPVVKTTSVDIADASFDKTAGVAVVPSASIAPVTTIEGLQSRVLIEKKELFTTVQGVITVAADKLLENSGVPVNERKEYQSVTFGAFNADIPADAKIGIVMYELPFNAQTKGDISTMKFLKYGWDGRPIEFTRVNTLEALVGHKYAVLSSDKKTPVEKLVDARYLIYGVEDGALEDLDGQKNSKVVDPAMVSVKALQSIAGVVTPSTVPDINKGATATVSIDWYQYGEPKDVAVVSVTSTSNDIATAVISPLSGISKQHKLVVSGHSVGSADITVEASSGALEQTVVIRVNVADPKGPSTLSGAFTAAPASMTVGQEIEQAASAWTFALYGGTPINVPLVSLDSCVIEGTPTNLTVTNVSKGVFKVVAGGTIGAATFTVKAVYEGVSGTATFTTKVEPKALDPKTVIKANDKFTFEGNIVKFKNVLIGNNTLLSASDLMDGYAFSVAKNTVMNVAGTLSCDVEQTATGVNVIFASKTEGTYTARVYLNKLTTGASVQAVPTDYTDVFDVQFTGKQPSGSSGGGGCNAAYAPFALLLAAPLFFLRKKK